jgi:hypothetical protein
MKFPGHITGPRFAEGDLISFTFDESELTLRSPKVPYNRDTIDRVCAQRDFRGADTSSWEQIGDEGHCLLELLVQTWNYEDEISHDDIAHTLLKIEVIKHSHDEIERCVCLNSESFKDYFFAVIKAHHEDSPAEGRPYWPSEQNNFFAKTIEGRFLDGLQAQVDAGGGKKYPIPSAYFSLGRGYTLRIGFYFSSLHYPDRKNPYSEELLQQFKLDVFDDFLSHIRIEYTPETIALIQKLKEQQQ